MPFDQMITENLRIDDEWNRRKAGKAKMLNEKVERTEDEAYYYAALGSPTKGVAAVSKFATQVRIEERKQIAQIMRLLEEWGQLNVKGFPLVTALVEKLERGDSPDGGELIERGDYEQI